MGSKCVSLKDLHRRTELGIPKRHQFLRKMCAYKEQNKKFRIKVVEQASLFYYPVTGNRASAVSPQHVRIVYLKKYILSMIHLP